MDAAAENQLLTAAQVAKQIGRSEAWVAARLGAGGYPTTQRSSDRAVFVRRVDVQTWRELSATQPPSTGEAQ